METCNDLILPPPGRARRGVRWRPGQLSAVVEAMYGLRAQAEQLLAALVGGGDERAGPTFEYVAPRDRR
jgi:hypothetical protein